MPCIRDSRERYGQVSASSWEHGEVGRSWNSVASARQQRQAVDAAPRVMQRCARSPGITSCDAQCYEPCPTGHETGAELLQAPVLLLIKVPEARIHDHNVLGSCMAGEQQGQRCSEQVGGLICANLQQQASHAERGISAALTASVAGPGSIHSAACQVCSRLGPCHCLHHCQVWHPADICSASPGGVPPLYWICMGNWG